MFGYIVPCYYSLTYPSKSRLKDTQDMSRRRKQGSKSLDVTQRLQQRVAEGDYYEALQLYKTSYSRLKAQGKLDMAEELLTTGAIAMCSENEVSNLWLEDGFGCCALSGTGY